MENKSISYLEYFIYAILAYVISYYVLIPLFFPQEKSCGCNKNKRNNLTEADVSPRDKACIAVGVCDAQDTLGIELNPVVAGKWKARIIESADKIFANNIPTSKKVTTKKSIKKNKK